MEYDIVVSGAADEERRQSVRDALSTYNRTVCPDMQSGEQPGHLDAYLLDSQGQVRGGLLGLIRWGWLEVHELALIPELRGQGLGSLLMRMAEVEARKGGCTRSVLDTATFQARPFYEKLGYRLIGELPDVLPGAGCYWLAKALGAGPQDRLPALVAGYEITVCSAADPERSKQVSEILMAYNVAQNEAVRLGRESGHWGDPLDVYLLDEQGNLAGGFVGTRRWHDLLRELLWFAVGLRGRGGGRRMLEAAVAEARRHGCTHVQNHIHGFHAPGFWSRLGYRCIGQIEDYPPGHPYFWLTKDL
jgi:GNAT superfamily N-acetyltransferase